jgi:hypothetical protein
LDVRRDGETFLMQLGPGVAAGSKSTPLAARPLDDSFAAAHIVRASRDLAQDGSVPVVELFLNLDPVWTITEMFAPPEVKDVLASCGATSIHGVSVAAGLGRTGIDEVIFVDAPGGRDLLTRVIAGRPLDAQLARFLPHNAPSASLGTLDVQALFDGVQKLLPDSAKAGLAQGLDGLGQQGFDLRNDLIANIGPTFAFSGDVDAIQRWTSGQLEGALDVTLVVQVADTARLKGLIDRALASTPAKSRIMEGFATWSLEPVPLPDPSGKSNAVIEPSWYVGENALVVSLTSTGLARALLASKQTGSA